MSTVTMIDLRGFTVLFLFYFSCIGGASSDRCFTGGLYGCEIFPGHCSGAQMVSQRGILLFSISRGDLSN